MAIWTVAVEGDADVPVVGAILAECGQVLGRVYGGRGKHALDARVRGYCSAAERAPWLIVRDLDHDAACAPSLVGALLAKGPQRALRVAVRAVEAWLLADAVKASEWLGVTAGKVPKNVDEIPDPKLVLTNLARVSRRKAVREDIVPIGTARIGPGYVDQVRGYCARLWRPAVAAASSPSLSRCLAFVRSRGTQ